MQPEVPTDPRGTEIVLPSVAEAGNDARVATWRSYGRRLRGRTRTAALRMHGGALTESAEIDPEQWTALVSGTNELARYLLEEYGVKLVFHPHADTHVDTQDRVERFLSDTDPSLVNLCLDTGHIAYCDGNNVEIIRRFPERITYVHLKQVEPAVRERVRREKLSLAEAVPLGVMGGPPCVGQDIVVRGRASGAVACRQARHHH